MHLCDDALGRRTIDAYADRLVEAVARRVADQIREGLRETVRVPFTREIAGGVDLDAALLAS